MHFATKCICEGALDHVKFAINFVFNKESNNKCNQTLQSNFAINLMLISTTKLGFLTFGVIRAVCNGWCTARRFVGPDGGCFFGGASCGEDSLQHYLECRALRRQLGFTGYPCCGDSPRAHLFLDPVGRDTAILTAIRMDLGYFAFNALRAGGGGGERVLFAAIRARLRELHRMSTMVHQLLLDSRGWT